jgi:hypothetical protein
MEHKIKLHTRENGRFVEKTVVADRYYSISPYQEFDYDIDETAVLTVPDLYFMLQEMKEGDRACKESGWKYHFYRHVIKVEPNDLTGKPEFVDYVTPGKVYRRGNKVFFKPISEV